MDTQQTLQAANQYAKIATGGAEYNYLKLIEQPDGEVTTILWPETFERRLATIRANAHLVGHNSLVRKIDEYTQQTNDRTT